jgi:hypothetical protein
MDIRMKGVEKSKKDLCKKDLYSDVQNDVRCEPIILLERRVLLLSWCAALS